MSKHANKQRMKRRLIDALCRHNSDLDFERAVMGEQFRLWTYTHKQLKTLLHQSARLRYNNGLYCSVDGIMTARSPIKKALRHARHLHHVATSVSG